MKIIDKTGKETILDVGLGTVFKYSGVLWMRINSPLSREVNCVNLWSNRAESLPSNTYITVVSAELTVKDIK